MIIETLYASLRQSQMIVQGGSKEWHTHTRMDDVDYLFEDNAMSDFLLIIGDGWTHGKPTLKIILSSNYREGNPW